MRASPTGLLCPRRRPGTSTTPLHAATNFPRPFLPSSGRKRPETVFLSALAAIPRPRTARAEPPRRSAKARPLRRPQPRPRSQSPLTTPATRKASQNQGATSASVPTGPRSALACSRLRAPPIQDPPKQSRKKTSFFRENPFFLQILEGFLRSFEWYRSGAH